MSGVLLVISGDFLYLYFVARKRGRTSDFMFRMPICIHVDILCNYTFTSISFWYGQ